MSFVSTSTRITILLPSRTPKAAYLKDAVNSVLCQTTPHWELIIIRDADDPQFDAVWSEITLSHKHLRIITNRGWKLTGALNTGAASANTDFVALLLGDDRLDVTAVETLSCNIERNPNIDFFYSGRKYIDDRGQTISSVYMPRKFSQSSDFLHGSPVKHLMCWRRAKAISAGGFDPALGLHAADDYDFPWTMFDAGLSFMPIDACLYHYRDHRSHFRLTTDVPIEVQQNELRKILVKHRISASETETEVLRRTSRHLRQAHKHESWKEDYQQL